MANDQEMWTSLDPILPHRAEQSPPQSLIFQRQPHSTAFGPAVGAKSGGTVSIAFPYGAEQPSFAVTSSYSILAVMFIDNITTSKFGQINTCKRG